MSYSLNSIKGDYIGDSILGSSIRVIKGDTRSLDYSSYRGMGGLCRDNGNEIWFGVSHN